MTSAEPKGRSLKWKGLTKPNIDVSASGGAAQTREINGRGSTREKRTKN